MGTRGGGVSVFNGLGFENYGPSEGLSNLYVNCLYQTSNGKIWVGTENGLFVFNGIKFESYPLPGDASKPRIFCLHEENENLWVGFSGGLIRITKNEKNIVKDQGGKALPTIYCLSTNASGGVMAGGEDGIYKISGVGTVEKHPAPDGGVQIRALIQTGKDKWLVGTYGSGVLAFEKGTWSRPSHFRELRNKIIYCFYADNDKKIWAGTHTDGIYLISPDSSLSGLSEKEGLSNNHVKAITKDRWGNYWIGTSGGGVSKYSGQKFLHYSRDNGLPANFIHSVFFGKNGKVYAGAGDKGLVLIDSGKIFHYGGEKGFKDVKVKAICSWRGEQLFLGTEGSGLFVWDTSGYFPVREMNGRFVRDLKTDARENLWVATSGNGIFRIVMDTMENRTREIKQFTNRNGLKSNRINCLLPDPKGGIIFGSETGLGKSVYDSVSEWDSFGQEILIRSLSFDFKGRIWAGTAEKGIFILEGGMISDTLDTDRGLPSSNIYLICKGEGNVMYVGTEKGISVLLLNQAGQVTEIRHLGRAEGFLGIETTQNASTLDREGNLWFGTINGLTRYNPKNQEKNTLPPLLRITGINLFYESLRNTRFSEYLNPDFSLIKALEFEPGENHIGFEFLGINLTNPEGVNYSWILEGLESEWSPPGKNRSVTYSFLAPGKYTFRLKAMNEDGIWTPNPVSISFVIHPPFYATWWFRILAAGVLVGLIFLIFYARIKRIQSRNKRIREELRLQKKLLELEQKALRLQMNPHFIFHALNTIQGLIAEKDTAIAKKQLSRFSRLMRSILDNSRQSSIGLEQEIDTLEHYLGLEKFCSDDFFDYEIIDNTGSESGEILLPPMIIQPFVENAIIHGIKRKESRGKIIIRFEKEGDFLKCTVEDNGIGREAALKIKAQEAQHHKSTALVVTQERLDILNPKGGMKSLEIEDLKNGSGEITGTRVTIRISQT